MAENLVNEFATTLAAPVAIDALAITVASTTGSPAVNFRIRVGSELMLVTAKAGVTWTVTREIEGTSAAAYVAGAEVVHVLTAGSLDQYLTERYQPLSAVLTFVATADTPDAAGLRDLLDLDATYQPLNDVLLFLSGAGSDDAGGVRTLLGIDTNDDVTFGSLALTTLTVDELLTVGTVGVGLPLSNRARFGWYPTVFPDGSGSQYALGLEASGPGNAGGVSSVRGLGFRVALTGSVSAAEATGITGDAISELTAGGVSTVAGASVSARNTNAGLVSLAMGVRAIIIATSTGNITEARTVEARAPTRSSTGNLVTITGMYVANQGTSGGTTSHGVWVLDQSGATTTYGIRAQVSSGTGKWNIYAQGTADNAFAGNVRIGSVVAPTVALDVTGAVLTSGDVTIGVNTAGQNRRLFVTGVAGFSRSMEFQTSGSRRWLLEANTTAESGANAGSNFNLGAYDDSGVFIGNAITINRSTMAATFAGAVTINGNVTLGDASGDVVTVNAATVTLNNNLVINRAVGVMAAGGFNAINNTITASGDVGGTSSLIGHLLSLTISGSNATNVNRGFSVAMTHSSSATQGDARAYHSSFVNSGAGATTGARNFSAIFSVTGAGNITTGYGYAVFAPILSSTGVITTNYGFHAGDIGHATLVGTAVAFKADNITASATAARGLQSSLSSGTNKRNLYIDGTAENFIAAEVRVGSDTTLGNVGGNSARGLQLAHTGNLQNVVMARFSADTNAPALTLLKSRNNTPGSFTVVQNGDQLGRIVFAGDDGVDYISAGAEIRAQVTGAPGSDDLPTDLIFSTTPDGSSSFTERLRISSAGLITVTGSLSVTGDSTLGDASGDTLTINAGTWTFGANYNASRSAGNLAAGTTTILSHNANWNGDAGGTTDGRAFGFFSTIGGASAVTAGRLLRNALTHNATNTVTTIEAAYSTVQINTTGSATNARAHTAQFLLPSTGGITTASAYYVYGPSLTSTGAITTLNGFHAINLGNALVTTAVGLKVDDFTASTTMRGVQLSLSAGSGKHNLYVDGTAPSYFAGALRSHITALAINGLGDPQVTIAGTSGSASAIAITRWSADTGAPSLVLGKSRSGTIGTMTIVQDGDLLGFIAFAGADGVDMVTTGAQISAQVDGTPGADDLPTRLIFSVTADGASTITERMRISSAGVVSITGNLTVSGNTTLGDASADTLTINAGTWTMGSNCITTRAAGAVAAGSVNIQSYTTTASGDAGGTSSPVAHRWDLNLSGSNTLSVPRSGDFQLNWSGTSPAVLSSARVLHANFNLSGTGTIPAGRNFTAETAISGAGGIGTNYLFSAAAAALSGTGVISNLYGYHVGDLGHATLVTNAIGVKVENFTAGPTAARGIQSTIASGTGRHNLYIDGTAQNYMAGELGVGVAPSSTTQLVLAASTTAKSSLRLAHGSAPTSPVDGDVWTTTAGLFVRINGSTVGPLT